MKVQKRSCRLTVRTVRMTLTLLLQCLFILWSLAGTNAFTTPLAALSAKSSCLQKYKSSPFSSGSSSCCAPSLAIGRLPTLSSTSSSSSATEEQVSIETVQEELREAEQKCLSQLSESTTPQQVEAIRIEFLGKKNSPISNAMRYMRILSPDDKPKLGSVVNEVKTKLEGIIAETKDRLEEEQINAELAGQYVDITMPGLVRTADIGRRHPLSMTMEKALDIFVKLGYDTVTQCEDSPEIETDYYCFEALNCPKDHPARDMQDTFYLTDDREWMLRTHTSAVQIRQMEKRKPPLRIVAPGRVYRRDDIDATHSLMFHQVEILALEPAGELTLGHLKGTVEHFLKEMLGPDIKTRFRGSYFPFTEPSMEVDVLFRGKWMEVLGCGMVDPRVLEMAGIDPEEYSGFAAGFGVERFAMIIHNIKDLREFVKSDRRFLEQFPHFYDDGLTTFLRGDPLEKPEEDLRTEQVPNPPVNSWEELKTAKYDPIVLEGNINEATEKQVEKKPKAKSSAPAEIDISKLDLRVGVIKKAWEHPEADKLYCEEIDLGEESGPRQIASGLKAHYSLEELQGQRVIVLANLKARKLVGFQSHGMILCAADDKSVKLIQPPHDAPVGTRLIAKGFEGEPATENQIIKKKMLDIVFPDLKTNGDGIAVYKGIPLTDNDGNECPPCSLSNVPIA